MFLSRCADKIEWMQHHDYLHQMHMERAWRIFTCICVDYLGMPCQRKLSLFLIIENNLINNIEGKVSYLILLLKEMASFQIINKRVLIIFNL